MVDDEAVWHYDQWLAQGKNGCMAWAGNYPDLRRDPTLLLPGAKTVVSLAMNYYPADVKREELPQFAYYAYGRDYHEVMRDRARQLAQFLKTETGHESRVCVDSAPMRERYWAQRAGIGFIGLNGLLIVPGKGSYFCLCELLTTLELQPDEPCRLTCGECHACERHCPVGALQGGSLDARKCLSCQTIENHIPELPDWVREALGNRVYGCDECQLVCPHNSQAAPTAIPEFLPNDEFMNLDLETIRNMTQAQFSRIFSHSAVKRAKLAGLQRNAGGKVKK